ncbi:MAG TPA: pyrimidine-nucleoside phosphorylase [Candidatus Enterosoma merdigallinarum]|nr:pyrimidine-nucleoside phosphorylase [Candidatus Enterosoma merdigallinarum]
MTMTEIIEKKKEGQSLSREEIDYFIDGYCKNGIPDYQVSALLMAICFQGMDEEETFHLTESMLASGKTLDLSSIPGVKCDKHSTGGVGDKTSLILCPLVASLGVKVAKMSGRGLGFTGGTLDKLESIPGVRVSLSPSEFFEAVRKVGMAIVGQSTELVPADKKLYALRDVTGTVNSIPLIAASIMSKKLASGSDCILLDVKYGKGAFMADKDQAEKLAKEMVRIGMRFKKDTRAEITSMEQPLGLAIGNILEVVEAIQTLQGKGPSDLVDLVLHSGTTMLLQAGIYSDAKKARSALEKNLDNGKAFEVFRSFIKAQGGDVSFLDNPEKFPTAIYSYPVKSLKGGYIKSIDALDLGLISMELGAGREKKDDMIDPTAGIVLAKKVGDYVNKGDLLLTLYTERANKRDLLSRALGDYEFSDEAVTPGPVVEETIRLVDGEFEIEKE